MPTIHSFQSVVPSVEVHSLLVSWSIGGQVAAESFVEIKQLWESGKEHF